MQIVVPPPPSQVVADGGAALRFKVVNIGLWNMISTQSVSVAHGIADYTKIRSITVILMTDAGTTRYPAGGFAFANSGVVETVQISFNNTNVILQRPANGAFSVSTLFDDPAVNRGFIHILYEG